MGIRTRIVEEEVLHAYLSQDHLLWATLPWEAWLGWSPGLVVVGYDSCSKGCGFESRRRLLDGHFSH